MMLNQWFFILNSTFASCSIFFCLQNYQNRAFSDISNMPKHGASSNSLGIRKSHLKAEAIQSIDIVQGSYRQRGTWRHAALGNVSYKTLPIAIIMSSVILYLYFNILLRQKDHPLVFRFHLWWNNRVPEPSVLFDHRLFWPGPCRPSGEVYRRLHKVAVLMSILSTHDWRTLQQNLFLQNNFSDKIGQDRPKY